MRKTIALVLIAIAGCGQPTMPKVPPTAGDFVKNNDGIGSARVFGIDFTASVKSSGTTTEDAINANFAAPEKSNARKRFTLGDDLRIQLDSVDESNVRFMFNDRDFGVLNVGDKVAIDDEWDVKVNGNPRSPKSVE